jgi:hypothetical protein
MDIGFVILSHRDPGMLNRLVKRLNRSFDAPPIVCHHDTRHTSIDTGTFPSNVQFVARPIRTRWGHISLVQAFRIALRQLYEWKSPNWFVFLSGNDYPIKSGAQILTELRNSRFDAYLDHRSIPAYADLPPVTKPNFALSTRCPMWVRLAYNRYIARNIKYPGFNRKGRPCIRRFALRHPRWIKPGVFNDHFRCYAGDAWLTARANCAELLYTDTETSRRLQEYYRGRLIPDESFFQTILCNAPGLRLCNDNKRYADWSAGKPNPKWLGIEDLPALLQSNHHFARKFSEQGDARVLAELDRVIDGSHGTTSVARGVQPVTRGLHEY